MKSNNFAIGALVVALVAAVGAATLIGVTVEDGEQAARLIGLVLGTLAPMALVIAGLAVKVEGRQDRIESKLERVHEDTQDLTNGLLDSKIRAAVAEVLAPQLVDPDAGELLEADRAKRTRAAQRTDAARAAAELLKPRVRPTDGPYGP